MPLSLRPFTPADVPLMMDIQARALNYGIWAAVWKPGVKETFTRLQQAAIRKPAAAYFGVVDEDGATTIAAGRFLIHEQGRSEAEIAESMVAPPELPEGGAMRAIFALVAETRKRFMGTKPHVLISLLAVLPEHQRKGAGKILLDWICQRSDELGLEIMLEATEMGRPLYERYGFVTVEEHWIDLSKWGMEGMDRFTIMIRQPVKTG